MIRGTLRLYGPVGASIFDAPGDCITAKGVGEELDKLRKKGCGALDVYLSSDGGSVMEGLTVYHQLARYPGEVTVRVDGRALSIGSVIALAGSRLVMPRSALMMIHSPWIVTLGNSAELRKTADDLDVMAGTMRGIYARKSRLSPERITEMMDAETWLSADEARALGLADEVEPERSEEPAEEVAASAGLPPVTDLYRNTPPALRTMEARIAAARYRNALMRQRMGEIARSASATAARKIEASPPVK